MKIFILYKWTCRSSCHLVSHSSEGASVTYYL